jgi:sec-independent protein translocase protein TatA
MAWDDPVVWVLIVAVVVFLFGSSKIPSIARALGDARREFDNSLKGNPPGASRNAPTAVVNNQQQVAYTPPPAPPSAVQTFPAPNDPLVLAAQREGIDTTGKTREQIASELSWKLNQQ